MKHLGHLMGCVMTALVVAALPRAALATETCYRLPFNNPNLKDGWGSTCCGRTSPHRGVDFPQPVGTAIPVIADGVVALKAYSSCLGNVIVIGHPDGMYSGYCHMNVASPLAVGHKVNMSDIIGSVGRMGSCATGPHLHLTMSTGSGGWASGPTVDPYKYIESHKTCDLPPKGSFDVASCDQLGGWAQDPDAPKSPIDVHLYIGGPAGDPKAYGMSVNANLDRADLCTPLGSCNHAFSVSPPLSFFDGVTRSVYAYAIDSTGGANTELGSKTLHCDGLPIPELPTGVVRRHLTSADVLAAWKFAAIDIATLDDAALAVIPPGPNLTATPALVTVTGDPQIYLHEYDTTRPIAGTAVLTAWGLRRRA